MSAAVLSPSAGRWPGHAGMDPAGPGDPAGALEAIVTAAVPGLVEQLTARELEIPALLAAGMPNPRTAQELMVSLDTVKSTSATCWASSARPIAPRPSPGPASSASLPSAVSAADLGGHRRAAARLP